MSCALICLICLLHARQRLSTVDSRLLTCACMRMHAHALALRCTTLTHYQILSTLSMYEHRWQELDKRGAERP